MMICPSWVRTPTQPIALADLVAYLAAALYLPHGPGRVFETGGADVVSYGEIMQEYARQRRLRRLLIPVPLLTPRLSSLWLGLTTPVYARVGRELIDGLATATVVVDDAARPAFRVRPLGLRDAIAQAFEEEDAAFAAGPWSEAALRAGTALRWGGVRVRTRLVHSCAGGRARGACGGVRAHPAHRRRQRLVLTGDWMWRLRGFVDRLLGGVGMGRGRRDGEHLAAGDVLDCWRVEACEPGVRLRLAAEMKLPGPRLAPVRRHPARRRSVHHPPDRRIRPRRSPGPPLLARPVSDSRRPVPRPAAAHRPARGPGGVRRGSCPGRWRSENRVTPRIRQARLADAASVAAIPPRQPACRLRGPGPRRPAARDVRAAEHGRPGPAVAALDRARADADPPWPRSRARLPGSAPCNPAREPSIPSGLGDITAICVHPSHWRRGIGRRLCEAMAEEAHAQGLAGVMLWVLEPNLRARRFYESLGFRPDGGKRVFLERREAVVHEVRYRRPAAPATVVGRESAP